MKRSHWIIVGVAVLVLGVVGFLYYRRKKTVTQAGAASSAALGANVGLGSNILQFARGSLLQLGALPIGGPQ